MRSFIYLDHAATTPVDQKVREKMKKISLEANFNPSALYQAGQRSANHLAVARRKIAGKLKIDPTEIFFTSSASESNNLVLKGRAWHNKDLTKKTIIIGPAEHSSVVNTADFLQKHFGCELITAPCDKTGLIKLAEFKKLLSQKVLLVSVAFAASEIGTIQPIFEIAKLCQEQGIFLHVDGVQAADFFDLLPSDWGVSALTLSSHKIYGPSGIGLVYLKKGLQLAPLIHGGSQEQGIRAGTENVIAAVGFAEALALSYDRQTAKKIKDLTAQLKEQIARLFPRVIFTGHPESRLPSHLSMIVPEVSSQHLLIALDMVNIAASAGSACNLGQAGPSKILLELGYDQNQASSALRFTLGRTNHEDQIPEIIDRLDHTFKKLVV